MAGPVDRIKALKIEIENLEFQKEIFKHLECAEVDIDDVMCEIKTRDDQLNGLRDVLRELMSVEPVTDGTSSEIHNQQMRSPISYLPYEMLSAVFKKGPVDPLSRMKFALSVSQVSRSWRDTALQTPFLWSGIFLQAWWIGRGYRKFLEVLLQRSGSHPLDIEIRLFESDSPQSIARMNRIMLGRHYSGRSESPPPNISSPPEPETNCLQAHLDVVIPEVSRWRSFTYRCFYPNEILQITERLAYLSSPILESFSLEVTIRHPDRYQYELNDIFQGGAPMLTCVLIDGIKPIECLPPLSNITSLCLTEGMEQMGGADFLFMLGCLTAIVSLEFDGTVVEPEDLYELAVLGEGIEIATLRCFSFSADATPKYVVDGMLNTIRGPALESLTISNHGFRGIQHVEMSSARPPLVPPFLTLRSLKLPGINCVEFAEIFDFTHLPALETISLSGSESPMALLRFLLLFKGRDIVWPVLRFIALSHLGPPEFDELREIILYRHACGKPIEGLLFDPVSLKKFPENVEWFKQHGLTVQRGKPVFYDMLFTDQILPKG